MKNGYCYYLEIQQGEEFPFVGWSEKTISEETLRPNKGAEKVYIVKEVQKPPPKDRKVNRSRSAFINPVRYEKFSLRYSFLSSCTYFVVRSEKWCPITKLLLLKKS